eukprot:SAG11_NODE_6941_length_1222_cov_1.015138_1_plen_51_part_00
MSSASRHPKPSDGYGYRLGAYFLILDLKSFNEASQVRCDVCDSSVLYHGL